MVRPLLHYGIHFLLPIALAFIFFRKDYLKVTIILLLGIVIDVDHLLADPIFQADRCSINFHPLHSYWAITIYALLFLLPKTRLLGAALLLHILADTVDCLLIP